MINGAPYLLILLSPSPLLAAEQIRGFYGSIEGGKVNVSAHWQCLPANFHCVESPRIDLRTSGGLFGGRAGYTFNTYLAVEAAVHIMEDGDNNDEASFVNQSVAYSFGDVGLALRGDWPLARRWTVFARAAAVYEWLDASYTPLHGELQYTSLHGLTRELSGGLSLSIPNSGVNVRLSIDRRASIHSLAVNGWTLAVDFNCFGGRSKGRP